MKNRKQKRSTLIEKFSLTGLFTSLTATTLIFAAVITLVSFIMVYRDAAKRDAITSSSQAVSQVTNTITNYTDRMSGLMELICAGVSDENTDEFYSSVIKAENDIVSIIIFDDNGNMLNCWSGENEVKENIYKNLSYNPYADNQVSISKPHVNSLFEDYYPWVVTMSKCVNMREGKTIQIAMDISFSSIAAYVDSVGIGQHGYCYIVDNDDVIVYHPQQQLIYAGLTEVNYSHQEDGSSSENDVIYSVESIETIGWRVVGLSYVNEMITDKVRNVVVMLAEIVMILLIITILISHYISEKFYKPAKELTAAMAGFEGDLRKFDYTPRVGTKEINALSESFENMAVRIETLVDQVRDEEVSLRKTELKALQAQINPHFLYNTLDSISWMCEDGRNKEAQEMVNALARLFRISISKGHELIPIEKEIQHAESYLMIQKYRYKNQFEYNFKIDNECLNYICNKITLQPIIENAINHGLNMTMEDGRIDIEVRMDCDDILFFVIDNGVGMTEEECQEILSKEASDRTGIGIKNVNDRIKIYFGESYGLSISSELDEWTRVEIRMPKIKEGEYEEK